MRSALTGMLGPQSSTLHGTPNVYSDTLFGSGKGRALRLSFRLLWCISNIAGDRNDPKNRKVIYGERPHCKIVRVADHVTSTRKIIDSIRSYGSSRPRLLLNKHCTVCDFQSTCRNTCVDRDDLSLISSLSAKERGKYEETGISSLTQLSYGYRPRRQKRINSTAGRASPPTKHDHKLKALAIKKAQVHIVGTPSIEISGTPVFLDVEAVPDRGFYYLIGIRYLQNAEHVERSFWADDRDDERDICRDFLHALQTIDDPIILHYGAYEARFLRHMKQRYSNGVEEDDFINQLVNRSLNLLNVIYGKIYFPAYSNSLKEIARFLGFSWTHPQASGGAALLMRRCYELTGDEDMRRALVTYNKEDCRAVEVITKALVRICQHPDDGDLSRSGPINVTSLEVSFQQTFGKFESPFPDFEKINQAAYWDYQREKVYVRSNKYLSQAISKDSKRRTRRAAPIDKRVQIEGDRPPSCTRCGSTIIWASRRHAKTVMDLRFLHNGIKRNVMRYSYSTYRCGRCRAESTSKPKDSAVGRSLRAYIIYLIIELRLSRRKIVQHLSSLFGLPITERDVARIKEQAAKEYESAYERIIKGISEGPFVHVDETKAVIRGGGHYMWVFANMTSVAYVYAASRDARVLSDILKGFDGVLISDFYAAYESIACPQQRCLIHLMRDINEDVLKSPFNDELGFIAKRFGILLRGIVDTVDRYGLKARHLRKHESQVESFFEEIGALNCHSQVAEALRKGMEKNRDTLFTFLNFDGVPWNNNNAEHALRAYTRHRNAMSISTPKGTREYAILLSIQQTIRFRNLNFLDFLRSGSLELSANHL